MSRLKHGIIAILVVFFLSSLTKNLLEYRKNLAFHESFKNEYNEKNKRNIELKTLILKQKDQNEIEKTIRNKLNLSQANEVVIMVPSPTPTPTIYITPTLPVYKEWASVYFTN